MAYPVYEIGIQIYSSLLLFLGLPLNIISIIIVAYDYTTRLTTKLLMIILSITDSLVIAIAVLRYWIFEIFKIDIRSFNITTCMVHPFLVGVVTDLAVGSLCFLAIERFIVVVFPQKSNQLINVNRILLGMLGFLSFTSLKNTATFVFLTIAPINSTNASVSRKCIQSSRFHEEFATFGKVDFISFSVIPYVILFSTNIYIYIVLRKQHILLSKNKSSSALINDKKRRKRRPQNVMKILTGLTIIHVVTTLPGTIFTLLKSFFPSVHKSFSHDLRRVLTASLALLVFTNNALNFFVYYLSSTVFRRNVVLLFIGKINKVNSRQYHSTGGNITKMVNINKHTDEEL